MIYPEGNFIESSDDTPFFQVGETKYGKPIIVRAYDKTMSFAETVKLLIVSFDSTLKSNLSVGLPLDLLFYEKDSFKVGLKKRIGQDDPYYRTVSDGWSNALKQAFKSLPDFPGELAFPELAATPFGAHPSFDPATQAEVAGEVRWTAKISEIGRGAPPTGARTIAAPFVICRCGHASSRARSQR